MNELTTQEPISHATSPGGGHWRWLIEPVAGRWLLPLTGLWILGLDWLLFPEDALSFGLASSVIGFLGGAVGTYIFERRFAKDHDSPAWLKALVAGLIVGAPYPLAGTVVGGWIVVRSGLTNLKSLLLRR